MPPPDEEPDEERPEEPEDVPEDWADALPTTSRTALMASRMFLIDRMRAFS
jgi:hypothetical protein